MNILIVSQMGVNSRTGVKTYFCCLRDHYLKCGHHVTVITPFESPNFITLLLKIYRKISLFVWPADFNKFFVGEVYFFVSIFFAVKKAARRQRWDIIHGQEAASTYAAQLALKRRGTPAVTTCHYNDNPIVEIQLMYQLSKRQLHWGSQWFNFVSKKNNNYIFVSSYVYEQSKELFNHCITKRIIPNGVAFPPIKLTNKNTSPLIISNIGSLEERKNQILLIKAAKSLVNAGFDFKIWLLGDGPKMSEWKREVLHKGLEEYVLFWGFRSDRLEIISQSNLYIHTAHNENCGLAILEAFSVGLPILALKVGGVPEQFPDSGAGLLSDEISPQELADAIIACSDKNYLDELQSNQYAHALNFDINYMLSNTLNFYHEILNETREPVK